VKALVDTHAIIGMDAAGKSSVPIIAIDLTQDILVAHAFETLPSAHGGTPPASSIWPT
jgi:hypothetical protein